MPQTILLLWTAPTENVFLNRKNHHSTVEKTFWVECTFSGILLLLHRFFSCSKWNIPSLKPVEKKAVYLLFELCALAPDLWWTLSLNEIGWNKLRFIFSRLRFGLCTSFSSRMFTWLLLSKHSNQRFYATNEAIFHRSSQVHLAYSSEFGCGGYLFGIDSVKGIVSSFRKKKFKSWAHTGSDKTESSV